MPKNLQEMEEDGVDLISNLPKNILDMILIHMPIKDAVRTSILSWKWRHAWASIPVLQFDDASLFARSENRQLQKRQKKKEGPTNRVGLTSIVDQVLLLHNGPIEKFDISIDLEGRSLVVDKWVLSLSGRGVKDLFLDFKKMDDLYIVPSCLFLCKQLRKLSLHYCILEIPPKFKGFCNLKALDLKDTTFTKETIESLISSCALLEDLKLKFDYWLESVTVCAPRLKILNLWGDFGDLSIVNATCLDLAEINFPGQNDFAAEINELSQTSNLDRALGSMVNLVELDIGMYTIQYFALKKIPAILQNSLDHLKCLKFNLNFFDSKECQVALCLFKSSPNLEEVEIIGDDTDESGTFLQEQQFWEEHHIQDCLFDHLKVIKMVEIHGNDRELGFIKFVLASAPVLETMTVEMLPWAPALQIMNSLLLFPRASAVAKVSCPYERKLPSK